MKWFTDTSHWPTGTGSPVVSIDRYHVLVRIELKSFNNHLKDMTVIIISVVVTCVSCQKSSHLGYQNLCQQEHSVVQMSLSFTGDIRPTSKTLVYQGLIHDNMTRLTVLVIFSHSPHLWPRLPGRLVCLDLDGCVDGKGQPGLLNYTVMCLGDTKTHDWVCHQDTRLGSCVMYSFWHGFPLWILPRSPCSLPFSSGDRSRTSQTIKI